MVKHTQTILWKIADELFECLTILRVWRLNSLKVILCVGVALTVFFSVWSEVVQTSNQIRHFKILADPYVSNTTRFYREVIA